MFLLAMGATVPAANCYAQGKMPCCPPVPYRYSNPGDPNSLAPIVPGPANENPEELANSPYDLGEGAPAQSGNNLAINDTPAFIGDFFGGSSGGSSQVVIDRLRFSAPRSLNNITTFDSAFIQVDTGIGGVTVYDASGQAQGPLAAGFVEIDNPNINSIGSGQTIVVSGPAFTDFVPGVADYFLTRNPGTAGTVRDAGTTVEVENVFLSPVGTDPLPNSLLAGGFESIYDYTINVNVPNPGGSGVTGRQKLVENSSPIPRTRVFFNYSNYQNVQFTPYSVGVNQYVFGAEKAIGNGAASIEFRLPFASTLDADVTADSMTAGRATEFGNIPIFAKLRLLQGDNYVIGGGLGVTLPTAADVNVNLSTGENLVNVQNRAVHLLPFIGGVYLPNDRFYSQCLLQIDVDANGNPVDVTDFNGGRVQGGRLHDSTWLFASANVGYWLYRGDETERISGISPVAELHYNKTLNTGDTVSAGGFRIGDNTTDFEMINLVAGVNIEMFRTTYLSLAYVTPLTQGNDRAFDGEFRVLMNRYFW